MARINPAGQSWGEWFRPRFTAMGMSGAEFAQRVADAGGSPTTSKQTVSQWANGQNSTDADTAVIVAAIFREPPAHALRAAGFAVVAKSMEGAPVEGDLAGPPDPVIVRLLGLKGLTEEDKADLIDFHRKRKARLEADTVAMAETMIAGRELDDSA
jgi:transcriptional regulator with XRE-family HTH domain